MENQTRRLTVLLPKEVYEKLTEIRAGRGIKSDTEAVIYSIIETYGQRK